MGGVELIERACLARGVTQHQLRVGVACSHRRHSTRTAGRGSELNARQGQFVFAFCAKCAPVGCPIPESQAENSEIVCNRN